MVRDALEARWDAACAQVKMYMHGSAPERLYAAARELIEIDPEHEYGYRMAAEAQVRMGEPHTAVGLAKRALRLDPGNPFLHYRLSVMLCAAERLPQAQEHAREAVRRDPSYGPYWTQLGRIALAKDDRRTAARCARRALALDPDGSDALYLRAQSMPGTTPQELRTRLAALEAALGADPEDARIWYDKARAHLRLQELDLAEQAARQALLLDPTQPLFRRTLYDILKRKAWGYRILRWPGDLVLKGFVLISRLSWPVWILICLVGLGSRLFLVLVVLGILWLLLVFPVLKMYEFLTTADIRQRARETGWRQGGPLALHAWPPRVRWAVFLLLVAAFWGGLYHALQTKAGRSVLGWAFLVVLLLALLLLLIGFVLVFRDSRRSKHRRRALKRIVEPT